MDSEVAVLAEGDGVVTKMDAPRHHRGYRQRRDEGIQLTKFLRSNHGTCINQHPIVDLGRARAGVCQ